MSKRPREDTDTLDKKNTPLSREDAERLVAYLTKYAQSNEENAEDYHHKKQKNRRTYSSSLFGILPFATEDDQDGVQDSTDTITDILADVAVDNVTQEQISSTFEDTDTEHHTLTKSSYEIPYPKELNKKQISLLSLIPNIVKIQLEQSDELKFFRLCIFSTTDSKIANRYRAEDLRIESERRAGTLFKKDTFVAWIDKYFPSTRYDPKIGTKLSYSKIGKHMLKTYCVFIPLPVTASQIISFMSPIWIHDVKITASSESKSEICMAITSFADE